MNCWQIDRARRMHIDVSDLSAFYASPLGQSVRRLLGQRVRAHWRRVDAKTVIGLGYGAPYLGPFRGEARRVGALMPAAQGAVVWPQRGLKLAALVDEEHLPLPDNSVDHLLVVHCLELSERARPLLREMWRVLAPAGSLVMIVPNRRGVWARTDATPFGHGRPYSRIQLERLLVEALFTPRVWGTALHAPPLNRRMMLRAAPAWERAGTRAFPAFGGVIVVEAGKELMAPAGKVRAASVPVRELATATGRG